MDVGDAVVVLGPRPWTIKNYDLVESLEAALREAEDGRPGALLALVRVGRAWLAPVGDLAFVLRVRGDWVWIELHGGEHGGRQVWVEGRYLAPSEKPIRRRRGRYPKRALAGGLT